DGSGNPIWTPQTDNQPSLAIGALAFSPPFTNANPDPLYDPSQTLYAGIGNFSSSGFFKLPTGGVLRTEDGGTHWKLVDGGFFQTRGLQIDALVPTAISTDGDVGSQIVLAATQQGLYRSVDGGGTWSNVSTDTNPPSGTGTGLPSGNVSDLVADPVNPRQFYAAVPGKGIFRSTSTDDNVGAQWTRVDNGNLTAALANALRIRLTVSAAGSQPIYAAIVEHPQTTLSLQFTVTPGAANDTLSVPLAALANGEFQPKDIIKIGAETGTIKSVQLAAQTITLT